MIYDHYHLHTHVCACVCVHVVSVCGRVATGSEVDARYFPQSLSTLFLRVLLNPKHTQQDWMSRKSEGSSFLASPGMTDMCGFIWLDWVLEHGKIFTPQSQLLRTTLGH